MAKARNSKGQFTSSKKSNKQVENMNRAFQSFAQNASSLRRRIWERILDSRRDIDDECGYPSTGEMDVSYFRRLYDRNGIANRIVNIYPDECWKVVPTVFEDDDPNTETPFEKDLKELSKTLLGNSLFEGEEGNPLWEYCHRIDRLSGIGQYGVMLLGTDHGGDLEKPIQFNSSGKKTNELLHITCYPEDLVQIGSRDNDPSSPRFLHPEYYYIDFENAKNTGGNQVYVNPRVNGGTQRGKRVHWTRVIHVAEVTESSEIFAVPRIRPNYNRVYDLRKLLGGSGEMYWRGALPPLILSTDPTMGAEVKLEDDSEDAFEQMMNTLQRWAFIPAVVPHQISPTVVDPSKQIEVQLDAICIELDCPKRIFMGSERGELASSQDKNKWGKNVTRRQNRYITPKIIVPLIDRLINIGALSRPTKYGVIWPELESMPPKEQAEIARLRTESLVKFIQGDGEAGMSLMDFWTTIQGLTDEEAEGLVERAMELREEEELETPEDKEPGTGNLEEEGGVDGE